jgi:hypothetical protein
MLALIGNWNESRKEIRVLPVVDCPRKKANDRVYGLVVYVWFRQFVKFRICASSVRVCRPCVFNPLSPLLRPH